MPRRNLIAFLTLLLAVWTGVAVGSPENGRPRIENPVRQSAVDEATEKKVIALTRQSIQLLEKKKYPEAERVLKEALKLEPGNVINLYNYACLLSLRGQGEQAVGYLVRAAEAGWTDFTHMGRDKDLDPLRNLASYKKLVADKPMYQRRAAEKVVADLKKRFGEGYICEIDEERKLIFATNIDRTTLDELKDWMQSQATSQWGELFENRPDHFISVVVPSPEDYRELVKMPGVGGFYSDAGKILVCQRLGQVMTHEFTHALHFADAGAVGQNHPIWIAEGFASLYEAGRFEGDKLAPRDNYRLNMLQRASRGDRLIPLADLLAMKQPEFIKKATLAYGQSSSVMLYLYEQGLLRTFYDTYKATYEKDASGKLALERVTKKALPEFESDWKAWMVKRPPVPHDTGEDGVVIGARLADANDGLKIESLVPGSPAEKAGLKAGDVLVGVEDAQVRDYQSFVPMLIQFKPGDEVTVKLRREGEYFELPITLGRRSDVIHQVKQGR